MGPKPSINSIWASTKQLLLWRYNKCLYSNDLSSSSSTHESRRKRQAGKCSFLFFFSVLVFPFISGKKYCLWTNCCFSSRFTTWLIFKIKRRGNRIPRADRCWANACRLRVISQETGARPCSSINDWSLNQINFEPFTHSLFQNHKDTLHELSVWGR